MAGDSRASKTSAHGLEPPSELALRTLAGPSGLFKAWQWQGARPHGKACRTQVPRAAKESELVPLGPYIYPCQESSMA